MNMSMVEYRTFTYIMYKENEARAKAEEARQKAAAAEEQRAARADEQAERKGKSVRDMTLQEAVKYNLEKRMAEEEGKQTKVKAKSNKPAPKVNPDMPMPPELSVEELTELLEDL